MITNLGVGGKTYSPSEQNVSLFKAGMDSVRRMDKDGVRIGLRMSMCPRTITGNEGWKDFGLVRGLERPTQVGESESYRNRISNWRMPNPGYPVQTRCKDSGFRGSLLTGSNAGTLQGVPLEAP